MKSIDSCSSIFKTFEHNVTGDSIYLRSIRGGTFEAPSDTNKHSFTKKLRVIRRINDAVANFHDIKYLNSKSKGLSMICVGRQEYESRKFINIHVLKKQQEAKKPQIIIDTLTSEYSTLPTLFANQQESIAYLPPVRSSIERVLNLKDRGGQAS